MIAGWRWHFCLDSTRSCCCIWAERRSCHGGSWECTSARCLLTVVRALDSFCACACRCIASYLKFCVQWGSWVLMLRSVWDVCVVHDGLGRWCGVSVVYSMCAIGCEVGYLLGTFDCSELTLAFAGSYMCDCWVIWRVMVLGMGRLRAGARVFRGGLEGGGSAVGRTGL